MHRRLTTRPYCKIASLLVVVIVAAVADIAADLVYADERAQQPRTTTVGEDVGRLGTDSIPQIGSLMADVTTRLHSRDLSPETLARQQRIVDGLSKLIAQHPQSSAQQSASSNSGQQSTDSTGDRPGETGGAGLSGDPGDSAASANRLFERIWGHLPDQVRQQVETPLHEDFLPQYDNVIQDYFRRLATENPRK